jgi:hypothetical protein
MRIFKLVLLSLFRLTSFGVLKATFFVYIWSRPDAPFVSVASQGDCRTRVDAFTIAPSKGDRATFAQAGRILLLNLEKLKSGSQTIGRCSCRHAQFHSMPNTCGFSAAPITAPITPTMLSGEQ